MNKNNIKALFPEGVETITISKNDYDRLYGQLTYENIILQSKIDKAIDYLYEHSQYNDGDGVHYIKEDEYCVDYLLDILKEDK